MPTSPCPGIAPSLSGPSLSGPSLMPVGSLESGSSSDDHWHAAATRKRLAKGSLRPGLSTEEATTRPCRQLAGPAIAEHSGRLLTCSKPALEACPLHRASACARPRLRRRRCATSCAAPRPCGGGWQRTLQMLRRRCARSPPPRWQLAAGCMPWRVPRCRGQPQVISPSRPRTGAVLRRQAAAMQRKRTRRSPSRLPSTS